MKNKLTITGFLGVMAVLLLCTGCMTAEAYIKKGNASKTIVEAEAYIKKGKASKTIVEAEEYFEQAANLDPGNAANMKTIKENLIGRYLSEIRYQDKSDAGKKRSELYFQKAVALDPDNPAVYSNRAWYFYETISDHAAAAELFEIALALDPEFRYKDYLTMSFYELGLTYGKALTATDSSLFLALGVAFWDSVQSKDFSPEVERTLGKAIENLKKGYEIDIVQGKNRSLP